MKFLLIAGLPESVMLFRGPLILALIAHQLQVHVAAPDLGADSPIRRQLETLGVVVHNLPLRRTGLNPWADLRLVFHLWRLMRALRPRFVLAYTIKPVIYGSIAAWLAAVPKRYALITGLGYAFQGDDGVSDRRAMLRALVQRLYGLALRRTSKIFFQNPDDRSLFASIGILPPDTPCVIVNGSGVDIEEYCPVPVPDVPHFLLIARLLGDKGIREYALAAKQILKERPDAVFTLVGWMDENPDTITRQELDGWVAAGTINYIGRLSDVRPAIAACNVYVLPSYREGTPRTVLEAMAMGRAVITTDAPGCRETVVDGENGYLVPVRSADALAAAMRRFIGRPGLARQMGEKSRRIAEEKYDVRKVNITMLREMGIS